MQLKNIVTALGILLLAGCANNPKIAPAEQLQGADYGAYPANYQQAIKDYYSKTLFDPYSASYEFPEKPTKAYLRDAPMRGGRPLMFGYAVTACVNAKNRMGGYVGQKCKKLFLKDGKVTAQIVSNQFFGEPWYQ